MVTESGHEGVMTTLRSYGEVSPARLAQLSQLALSNDDFRWVQACKGESNQWEAPQNWL